MMTAGLLLAMKGQGYSSSDETNKVNSDYIRLTALIIIIFENALLSCFYTKYNKAKGKLFS